MSPEIFSAVAGADNFMDNSLSMKASAFFMAQHTEIPGIK
jgi:hypothetical protein